MARNKKYTDEQVANAQALIDADNNLTVAQACEQAGIPLQTYYVRKRAAAGKSDPTPGGDTKRARASTSPTITDEQLVGMITPIAVAPAVPAALWLHCDFCATHFATQGPLAASQLVELSKTNPALRKMLENGYTYFNQGAWALLFATYVGVPAAHHLAPDFVYKYAQMFLGLPAREVPHTHTAPPSQNGDSPTGFETLDTDQLAHMAAAMGIKLTPDGAIDFDAEIPATEVTEDHADSTEGADEPADDTGSGEDAAETAEADTNAEQRAT